MKLVLLAVCMALAGIGFRMYSEKALSSAGAARWIPLKRTALNVQLRELGTVVAQNETPVLSKYSGEIVWKIEEGAFVEPGTVIIRFDSTRGREELERLRQDLFDKEEAVRRARKMLDTINRKYKLEIANQEGTVEQKQIERDTLFGMPTEENRMKVTWDLESAQLNLKQAKSTFESNEDLFQLGFVTEAVLKKKKLDLLRASAECAKQKILKDLAFQGATSDAKRLAELGLQEAKINLQTAQFNFKADATIAQMDLRLAETYLQEFKLSLDRKERNVGQADCQAPVRGRVAFVDVWKGSRQSMSPIQIGESRQEGQDLCKIADISMLRIRILVNEADVNKLKPGQPASVKLVAYPERTFKATVAEVALVAKDKNEALDSLALKRSGEAFVSVVEVFLDFDDLSDEDRGGMRLGFTAEVTIDCVSVDEGPVVPWTAVGFDEKGEPFIEAKDVGGNVRRRTVKLGAGNDGFVPVLEGLDGVEMIHDHASVQASRGQEADADE